MRAREPDQEGYVERDGVKVWYEVFGNEQPAVLLLPAWSIVPSRIWKAQVPYLARHARVITFDPRGNGRSDHPRGAAAYAAEEFVADALDVLAATGTEQAVLVSLSRGNGYALRLAADHSERVLGWVALGPYIFGLGKRSTARDEAQRWFDHDFGVDEGWRRSTGTRGFATSAVSRSSSSVSCCRNPTPPSRSRTRSLGRWTSSRRLSWRRRRRPSTAPRTQVSWPLASAAPCWSYTGPMTARFHWPRERALPS